MPVYVALLACALGAIVTFAVLRGAPLVQAPAPRTVAPDRVALPALEVAFNPAGSNGTNVTGNIAGRD